MRILKILLLLVCIVSALGFGLCGTLGIVTGVANAFEREVVFLGLLGLSAAWGLGSLAWRLARSLKAQAQTAPTPSSDNNKRPADA